MRRGESGLSLLLGVDKPCGCTSHDVVGRVRRALGERRVGHAGTLDPAASGVLVVGVGQAARLLGMVTLDEKRYLARIAFGTETTTDDAEGEPVRLAAPPARAADADFAREALAGLVGEFDQLPPAYSAISVDGRRAYEVARSGGEPRLAPRRVRVISAELVAADATSWLVDLTVSKGTYVRSIARDLGRQLGSCAHVAGLRRTASGCVGLESCVSLERLEEVGALGAVALALDPVAVLGLPVRRLTPRERLDAAAGRAIAAGEVGEGERCCLVDESLMLGVWRCERGALRSVANLPSGVTGVRS